MSYNNVMPPLGENECLVTFLYVVQKRSVRLFGGPMADHEELQRLVGTDIWRTEVIVYLRHRFWHIV